MTRPRTLGLSLVAWVAVAAFWLVATRSRHPTWALAWVVTASLMLAYASASYVHLLVLIPRFRRAGRPWRYAALLAATMALFTGLALAVIRAAYFRLHGPDPDPNGAYVHYAIDLFGMAAHVLGAAVVAWAFARFTRPRA